MNVLFVLCCLVVAPVEPLEAASLKAPTIAYALSAIADNATTFVNLSHGFDEDNPVVRPFQRQPGAVLTIGVVADVATVTLLRKLGKGRPALAKWALYGIAAVKLALAINNFRAFHQWRRR